MTWDSASELRESHERWRRRHAHEAAALKPVANFKPRLFDIRTAEPSFDPHLLRGARIEGLPCSVCGTTEKYARGYDCVHCIKVQGIERARRT